MQLSKRTARQLSSLPISGISALVTAALILGIFAANDELLAQTRVYVPQVIAGGEATANVRTDFRTIFHVFNLAPDTVRIRIRSFQDDGEPYLALFEGGLFGSGRLVSEITYILNGFALDERTTATGAPDTSGWAVVEVLDFGSREPIESPIAVAVTLETRVRGLEGDTTRAALLVPPEPATSFFAYGMIVPLTSPIGATGIALLNPSGTAAIEATLQLVDQHGELEQALTIELEPRHKISGFLNDPGLFSDLVDFEGTVEVRSTGPVSAVVIRVGPTFWSSFGVFPGRPIPGLTGND